MHEMLTIVTDVRGVCLSDCLSRGLNRRRRVQCTPRAVCTGSFSAAFAKCLWPLVRYHLGAPLSGMHHNRLAAGLCPDPLRELTALPQTP